MSGAVENRNVDDPFEMAKLSQLMKEIDFDFIH